MLPAYLATIKDNPIHRLDTQPPIGDAKFALYDELDSSLIV